MNYVNRDKYWRACRALNLDFKAVLSKEDDEKVKAEYLKLGGAILGEDKSIKGVAPEVMPQVKKKMAEGQAKIAAKKKKVAKK